MALVRILSELAAVSSSLGAYMYSFYASLSRMRIRPNEIHAQSASVHVEYRRSSDTYSRRRLGGLERRVVIVRFVGELR